MNKISRVSCYLVFVLALLLSGCRSETVDLEALLQVADPYALADGSCAAGLRLFEHDLLATGARCLPSDPQRIIALESFEALMSFDAPPVVTQAGFIDNHALYFPALAESTAEVEAIAGRQDPSPERLLAVNPDLIIGSAQRWGNKYETLAEIAPTLLYDFEHSGLWQEVAGLVAEATNHQAAYAEQTAVYEERLAVLQTELAQSAQVASIVRILPNAIRLYTVDSFAGEILASAGLERPPSQAYTNAEMLAEFGQTTFYNISKERVEMADGDVIFLWTSSGSAELVARADERLAELRDDQLWGALDGVKNGRVYEVGGYWIGSSFIAAHYIIDDIYQYVLEKEPTTQNPFR